MRYYIQIDGDEYLEVSNELARIVRGQPDPFSRVTAPRIIWSAVKGDLPYLTEREIARLKRSKVAFTRFHEM